MSGNRLKSRRKSIFDGVEPVDPEYLQGLKMAMAGAMSGGEGSVAVFVHGGSRPAPDPDGTLCANTDDPAIWRVLLWRDGKAWLNPRYLSERIGRIPTHGDISLSLEFHGDEPASSWSPLVVGIFGMAEGKGVQ